MTVRETLAAIRAGLRAAALLAIGRADGLLPVDGDRATVLASFWALPICLALSALLRLADGQHATPPDTWRDGAADLLSNLVGWLAYVLVSRRLATSMGRGAAWPRYVVAWNWCNLVQFGLFLAAALPRLAGAPDWFSNTVALVALFWWLWLEWFTVRVALSLPRLPAAAFVAADMLIGLVLTGLVGIPAA